jgi:hypothetical protein
MPRKSNPNDAKPIALSKKSTSDWRGIRLKYPMTVHLPKGDTQVGEYAWLVFNVKTREQVVLEDENLRKVFSPRGKKSKESMDWAGSFVEDSDVSSDDNEEAPELERES